MLDLLKTYREETIAELLKIYMKSCILKEYFSIFPFLTKISFKDDQLYKFVANKLRSIYYQPVAPFLSNSEQFFLLCKESLIELQSVLESLQSGKVYDLIADFPNLAFIKYLTEENFINDYKENELKYATNNIFLEKYIRLEDATLLEARNASEIDFLNRENKLKGIVNIDVFDDWINSITLSQDRFLALVPNRYLGVRLVYNSPFHTNVNGHAQLFQSIISTEPRYVYEKTNALAFVHSEALIKYKFPLILAKKEVLFPGSLGSLTAMQGYVKSPIFEQDVYTLTNRLWEDANFSKLFNYHFPVKILQAILLTNFIERYKILRDVLIENKVFQDLSGTIINLLTRIKFAEDPTNI